MVDLTATQAQVKGAVPIISRDGGQRPSFTRAGQNVVAAALLLDTLPPPLAKGVDRLCHQLGEILAIAAAQ
jgi:hypothetical protein